MNRRVFLATTMGGLSFRSRAAAQQSDLPEPIRKLRPMLDGVVPRGRCDCWRRYARTAAATGSSSLAKCPLRTSARTELSNSLGN